MKIFIRSAAAALALSLVGVSGAEAQIVAPCANSEVSFFLSGGFVGNADDCAGWYLGNDSNQQSLVETEMSDWGFTDVTEVMKVEGSQWSTSEGPFSFGGVYTNFAVAVKAGNQFSLFHFASAADAFSFDLSEVSNGGSHWALYNGEQTTVPEPGTMLLLGTGLLGMAFARRREDEIEA